MPWAIAGREIALVVRAEHADVAGDSAGEHRRAAAGRFHHHVRAAFGVARVDEDRRFLALIDRLALLDQLGKRQEVEVGNGEGPKADNAAPKPATGA